MVLEHAQGLNRRGHDVTVLVPRVETGTWDRGRNEPLYLIRKLAKAVRDLVAQVRPDWYELPREVRVEPFFSLRRAAHGVDAMIATGWRTAEIVADMTPDTPAGFYLIQHLETWDGPTDRVEATWRLPLRKAVVSRWLYEEGLRIGVPASEMCHIPNGLDHEHLGVMQSPENRGRSVAMQWSSEPWKGGQDGLDALATAKRRFPDLQAHLFGTDPPPRRLPDWVHYWRSPARPVLVGDIYNQASVFLCSSWREGFGLPPAEAMACGCAVVTTDCGGVGDFAVEGETARVVPPRNPEALGGALCDLLEDDETRVALAGAGCREVQRLTWDRATDELEKWISGGGCDA